MARFNEILVGRFNRALQKLTGIKGGAPTPQLASEIIPVLPFFFGVENRYIDSWNRFGIGVQFAAGGAGNVAQMQLRNPSGSNVIGVVEKISVGAAAIANVEVDIGATSTDFAGRPGVGVFDSRGNTQPSLILSTQNAAFAGIGNTFWQSSLNANVMYDVIVTDDQEIPILPGQAVLVFTSVQNLALVASIWWRERALEESERF